VGNKTLMNWEILPLLRSTPNLVHFAHLSCPSCKVSVHWPTGILLHLPIYLEFSPSIDLVGALLLTHSIIKNHLFPVAYPTLDRCNTFLFFVFYVCTANTAHRTVRKKDMRFTSLIIIEVYL
jgi:hypothetical protein